EAWLMKELDGGVDSMLAVNNTLAPSVLTLKNSSGGDSAVLFLYPKESCIRWSLNGTNQDSTSISPYSMTNYFFPFYRNKILSFASLRSVIPESGPLNGLYYGSYYMAPESTVHLCLVNTNTLGIYPSTCVDDNDTVHYCFFLRDTCWHIQWAFSDTAVRDTTMLSSNARRGVMHLDGDTLIQVVYEDTSGSIRIMEWEPGTDPENAFRYIIAEASGNWQYAYPDIQGNVAVAIKRKRITPSFYDTTFLVLIQERRGPPPYGWDVIPIDTTTRYLYSWPHLSPDLSYIVWTAYTNDTGRGKVLWKQLGGQQASFPLRPAFALYAPYPSPSKSKMTVQFLIPGPEEYALRLYDVAGRRVATLAEGRGEAGLYTLTWFGTNENGSVLPAGVYFLRLTYGDSKKDVKKVVWMR
ncbi:MAG: FlgD immunoglobulin-like domain containing protein, partial [candidate division WOR-3 bacterium]